MHTLQSVANECRTYFSFAIATWNNYNLYCVLVKRNYKVTNFLTEFSGKNGHILNMGLYHSGINAFNIGRHRIVLPFYWRQTKNNSGNSTPLHTTFWTFWTFIWFKLQEYFLADSGVSIYPVSFSLMASFMSAITLVSYKLTSIMKMLRSSITFIFVSTPAWSLIRNLYVRHNFRCD